MKNKYKTIAFVIDHSNSFTPNYPRGWGNGYVAVSPEHPLYGIHYLTLYDILPSYDNLNVHGEITFSDKAKWFKEEIRKQHNIPDNWWVFGFDTAHYLDCLESWPEHEVWRETRRFEEQLANFNLNIPLYYIFRDKHKLAISKERPKHYKDIYVTVKQPSYELDYDLFKEVTEENSPRRIKLELL